MQLLQRDGKRRGAWQHREWRFIVAFLTVVMFCMASRSRARARGYSFILKMKTQIKILNLKTQRAISFPRANANAGIK
jgi:hypothetical protein